MHAGKPHTSVLLLNAGIYLLFGHLFSTSANHAVVSTFLVWVLVFYQLGPFWLHTQAVRASRLCVTNIVRYAHLYNAQEVIYG